MATPRTSRLQAALLLSGIVACAPQQPGPPPTRAADFDTTQVDTASVATMRAYGVTLDFDSVLGAADAQPLFAREGRRYGFAKIEPERGAYRLDTAAAARGRIIARISSESAYAALGLGRGVNWWWVDKKGGKWRSIIYSEAQNQKSVNILDSLQSHPGHEWRQSVARFVVLDTLVAAWGVMDNKCVPRLPVPLSSWPPAYWPLERAQPWATPGTLR